MKLRAVILPPGVASNAAPLLAGRALRAFADGYVVILLPAYLLALGMGLWEVGLLSSATLLGSALLTLAVGAWGHHVGQRRLLMAAAMLMAGTGLGVAGLSSFWPLLLVAFVGTLNPSAGDVSVFVPLEHARLADCAHSHARTALFARYSLAGALFAAFGSLFAGAPDWLGVDPLAVMRGMFVVYGLVGAGIWLLYRRLPTPAADTKEAAPSPLGPSRGVVIRLAALFSLDAFAGGLVVNSLLALWLFERFGVSLSTAGVFFFWTGLLGAFSQLVAPWLAQRIGLLNTMVLTHIPANLCLIAAAFAPSLPLAMALLLARAATSQMDVPARTAYVIAVVTAPERAAAASFTAVPRSLAAAISPSLGGAMFAAGWLATPLVACGVLKIAYDLALWRAFRRHEVRES